MLIGQDRYTRTTGFHEKIKPTPCSTADTKSVTLVPASSERSARQVTTVISGYLPLLGEIVMTSSRCFSQHDFCHSVLRHNGYSFHDGWRMRQIKVPVARFPPGDLLSRLHVALTIYGYELSSQFPNVCRSQAGFETFQILSKRNFTS